MYHCCQIENTEVVIQYSPTAAGSWGRIKRVSMGEKYSMEFCMLEAKSLFFGVLRLCLGIICFD